MLLLFVFAAGLLSCASSSSSNHVKQGELSKRSSPEARYDWSTSYAGSNMERPIIGPSDYLALVKKTVTSALKDPQAPLLNGPDRLSDKTKKWLYRAEAALTKDPNIIALAIAHYDNKYNAADDGSVEELRAFEKKQQWANIRRHSRDHEMTSYLMDGNSRYDTQIRRCMAKKARADAYGTRQEALESAAKLQNLLAMKEMWNRPNMSRSTAIRHAKAELLRFKESWDQEIADGEDNRFVDEMKEHAMNAIGWNMKARSAGMGI